MQKYTKQQEFEYELNRFRSIITQSEEITKLHQAQELVVQIKGFSNWHDFQVIHKHQAEYLSKFNYSELSNSQILSLWKTMFSDEQIQILDIEKPNHKKIKEIFICNDIEPIKIPIFEKTVKTLFSKKKQDIYLEDQDFPMFIVGNSGSGKTELMNNIARQIINKNKGYVFIDGTGDISNFHSLIYYAKESAREKDFLFLNFLSYEKNNDKKLSNSINPLDMLLQNQQSFERAFGKEIGKWLFPALKSYEKKGKKISLKSLSAFIKLPQILLMANSDEWDNRKEARDYLATISMSTTGELTNDEIKEISIIHTMKSIQALQVIDIFNMYIDSEVFSDYPEFSFNDVIKDKKILLINFPRMEKTSAVYHILKNIIHELIINADKKYGDKENFISFLENSNSEKFKSHTINSTFDIISYAKEIFNFSKFYYQDQDEQTPNEEKTNKNEVYLKWDEWDLLPSHFQYKSYYFMRQEDPGGIKIVENIFVKIFWLYSNLDSLPNILDIKSLYIGEGFLIKTDIKNKKLTIDKYFFKYQKTPRNIYIKTIKEEI